MNRNQESVAYHILELERRLAAYQKVHTEELDELKELLLELKDDFLNAGGGRGTQDGGEQVLENR